MPLGFYKDFEEQGLSKEAYKGFDCISYDVGGLDMVLEDFTIWCKREALNPKPEQATML